jgi:hypothetical protein
MTLAQMAEEAMQIHAALASLRSRVEALDDAVFKHTIRTGHEVSVVRDSAKVQSHLASAEIVARIMAGSLAWCVEREARSTA